MEYDERVALIDRIERLEKKIGIVSDLLFRIAYSKAPMSVQEAMDKYSNE
jgi:hypothetical protein